MGKDLLVPVAGSVDGETAELIGEEKGCGHLGFRRRLDDRSRNLLGQITTTEDDVGHELKGEAAGALAGMRAWSSFRRDIALLYTGRSLIDYAGEMVRLAS